MKSVKHILFLFLAIALWACEKDPVDDCLCTSADYIVFGRFYGKCIGEGCVEIFKVDFKDESLIEETTNKYPGDGFYLFEETVALPNSKYDEVKDLVNEFPQELLDETSTVLGVPDGGDWGGVYVEIKTKTIHKYFLLDQNDNNMSAIYNAFVDKVNEKIAIINQ